MTTKTELRQHILKKRLPLTDQQVANLSSKITRKVLGLKEFKNSRIFAIYLPIHNEVETKSIIDHLLKNKRNIYLPTFDQKTNDYKLSKFSTWQNLVSGPYEILQPNDTESISPLSVDVALIPGVAFSKSGVRLGYGKGVYDRLFHNAKALKIGLAYQFQIIDEIPKEEHDLLMDVVVTEDSDLRFISR